MPIGQIEVREAKNEVLNSPGKTLKDIVEMLPQPAMDKMEVTEEQISDASKVLGVVRIKHNY